MGLSKRQKRHSDLERKVMPVELGIDKLKEFASEKFKETVDVVVKLGIDPKQTNQGVRGSVSMPAGTGKDVKVAVFAPEGKAQEALDAGADRVGMQDLADELTSGSINYDVIIAAPEAMGVVGKLGPVLGPRNLMPNPKIGTVSVNVANAVKTFKSGQVKFGNDKYGQIHCGVGKIHFTTEDLSNNIKALISELQKVKPSTSKGVYINKVFISTTMGPSVQLSLDSIK